MKKIFNYLFKDNPVFTLVLGLCSLLAVTTTFEKSYMMGIVVLIVLLISNTVVSIIRKFVNDEVRIPVYIIIISTIVTIIQMILNKYSKPLYDAFGIYLPLVIVYIPLLLNSGPTKFLISALSFCLSSVTIKLLPPEEIVLSYVLQLPLMLVVNESLTTKPTKSVNKTISLPETVPLTSTTA